MEQSNCRLFMKPFSIGRYAFLVVCFLFSAGADGGKSPPPRKDPKPAWICARAMAILSLEQLPFNASGWGMVEPERSRSEIAKSQKQIVRLFGENALARAMGAKVASSTKSLPADFLFGLDLFTQQYVGKAESGEMPFSASTRLVGHPRKQDMVAALENGYDSESSSSSSGSARGWAAWIAAEAGMTAAVPFIRESLAVDLSDTAKQQYIIALGRLDAKASADAIVTTLKKGSKSANKWSSRFSFWLDEKSNFPFQFDLSDRGAAAIASGYLSDLPEPLAIELDQSLLSQLSDLLSDEVLNSYNTLPMRKWKGVQDGEFEQTGASENNACFIDALVFAVARRKTPGAFELLARYFNSLGYHSTGAYEDPAGNLVNPLGVAHSPNVPLLMAALHRLNPEGAVHLWREKVKEVNSIFRSAESDPEHQYVNGAVVWRYMYLDDALYSAAKEVFPNQEWRNLVKEFPRVPHKTHSSF